MRLYFLFFSFLHFPQCSMCYCELRRYLINAGWLSKWKAPVYFGQMSFGDTSFIIYPFDKTSHPQIPPNIYYLIFKAPSHSPQGRRRGQELYSHFDRWEKLRYKEFNSPLPWQPSQSTREPVTIRLGSWVLVSRGTSQNPSLLQDRSLSEEGGGSRHEIKCLAKHKGRLPNTVRSSHLTLREHSVHAINLHSLSAHFTINTSDSLSREIFFILINSMQNVI